MDFKTELTELKGNLSAFMDEVRLKFSTPETPQTFGEATLTDGTQVVFEGEAPAVGGTLNLVAAEGQVPAPDGVHETESGLVITTADGVITDIQEKAAEEEQEAAAEFASLEQFDALRAENEALRNDINSLKETVLSIIGKVDETFSVFEKFAGQTAPPAKPIVGSTNKKIGNLIAFANK
jgi:FtsZ-binding cell division protein ZapB